MLLRAQAGEAPAELAEWWTQYQAGDDQARGAAVADAAMIDEPHAPRRRPRKRRSRSATPPANASA
jgi:poly(A) polymerase